MKKTTKQITVFVGICIKNKKILLTQRFEPACSDAHLKWELPGGKCDYGENPADSIVREFKEETGAEVRSQSLYPYVYTHYWKYEWGTQQTFIFVYKCKFVRNVSKTKDKKIKAVQWVPLSKVLSYDLLGGTEVILKQTIKSFL